MKPAPILPEPIKPAFLHVLGAAEHFLLPTCRACGSGSVALSSEPGTLSKILSNTKVILAGSITLESFFRRIPKQEQHPPPTTAAQPQPGSTAQHAGAASGALQEGAAPASRLPVRPAEKIMPEKIPLVGGHAEDSMQERRKRLLRAAQQRVDRLVRCCLAPFTFVHCAGARLLWESLGCPRMGAG